MPDISRDDRAIRAMLAHARVIAVVGHSDKPNRTSYRIAEYLREAGYRVYPVNPTIEAVESQPSYPSLKDVPEPVDIVNVFRRSEYLAEVVDDAIEAGIPNVWAQLGVYDEEAAQRAIKQGLHIVMNRCIKVEHLRLSSGVG